MGKILLYNVPQETHRKISELCLELNIDVKKIPKRRYFQSIGCHAGAIGYDNIMDKQGEAELAEAMLVFYDVNDKKLDLFLAKYKEKNINPIGCKAIITRHNIGWNAYELFEELKREREELNFIANTGEK